MMLVPRRSCDHGQQIPYQRNPDSVLMDIGVVRVEKVSVTYNKINYGYSASSFPVEYWPKM